MSSSPDPVCFVSGVGNAVEQGTPLLSSPCLSYSLLSSHFPSSLLASVFSSPFSSCFLSSSHLSSSSAHSVCTGMFAMPGVWLVYCSCHLHTKKGTTVTAISNAKYPPSNCQKIKSICISKVTPSAYLISVFAVVWTISLNLHPC